ncbi:hypothetical protein OXX59_002851 [Metschnikowia pulcherrima]
MTSEGTTQFSSGSSLLHPINLGGPPNLLGGYPMPAPQSGSLAPGSAPQNGAPSMLKLTGLPNDVSQREVGLIFALVSDDILSIDLSEKNQATVMFKNANTCVAAGKSLDGKYIFGHGAGPVKVEYDHVSVSSTTSAFDGLRLSRSGISPPNSHSLPQGSAPSSAQPSQLQHGPGAGIDNYQKRASIGNQRSRFLFSDPFAGAAAPPSTNPGSIDLSDLTGKSLLMMKQNDGREYESMPRDPWGSQSQGNIGLTSNPQTPGLSSVHNSYDWGSGANNLPASASASQPPHSQHAASLQPSHSSSGSSQMPPFISSAPQDRRRTSSFFSGPTSHVPTQNQGGHDSHIQQPSQSTSGSQLQQQGQHDHQHQHQVTQTVASIISQGPTQSSSSGMPSSTSNATRGSNASGPQNTDSQPAGGQTPVSVSGSRSSSKDVPDLSLLARVPPPANPADQNPPCNTLYVGNLPPDATETELRSLFAPQKGFRRLSFRTKNQSGSAGAGAATHNHGPMCFVEFEDVAHATIALAELYGRALPRPNGGNGKGGIRLSFSKNPLGVRGPGNPRRASTNSQPPSSGGSTNGVGNYGYSNYH